MIKKIKKWIKNKITIEKKEKIIVPVVDGHFLDNRQALITGGSSGIGYAIAESFLRNGANVIITGRNKEKLIDAKKKLVKKLKIEETRIYVGEIDIAKINLIEDSFCQIADSINAPIDIFVNNAGANGGDIFPNTCEKDYDRIFDTNLKGRYFISQVIVKYMLNNKIHGNILNITSSSALRPGISPYIISKWGENSLTLGMAKKYLPYGIIVNGLAPGSTNTPMLTNDADNLFLDYSPAKRYLAPEEVGNMATILVSDLGRMIIGDTIYMTGGAGIITYDDISY